MTDILRGTDAEFATMNALLAQLQDTLCSRTEGPKRPVLFIIGVPRTGSTFLTQVLVNHLHIGYATNFISRFWECPAVGALLQQQAHGLRGNWVDASSRFGQTNGVFGPHEFGFFWRRWFAYGESHYVGEGTHGPRLRSELGTLEAVFDAPVMFKNLAACGLHARWLAELLPTARFLLIRRDPYDTACSIRSARIDREGGEDNWFSVKPPTYPEIAALPMPEQIARQVLDIELHIADQLSEVSADRWAVLDYTELVQDPGAVVDAAARAFDLTPRRPAGDAPRAAGAKVVREQGHEGLRAAVADIVEADADWRRLYAAPSVRRLV